MDSKQTDDGSQTPRSQSRIQSGIVLNWDNHWNPLLRRPRKTFRHIDSPPNEGKRRNKSRNAAAVRSRFTFFMNMAKSNSVTSAKSSLATTSEPAESLAGDDDFEDLVEVEGDDTCAADIAYHVSKDPENPYHGGKSRMMRQYHIWNGVDLKKIALPPLPAQERQRASLADAWKNSNQAVRQLGNVTRRGPHQRQMNKPWQTQSLPNWTASRSELEREENAVQKIVRDAACYGTEMDYTPNSRPKTAPGVIYDPRTTWTVKCMQEARIEQPRCDTSRVSSNQTIAIIPCANRDNNGAIGHYIDGTRECKHLSKAIAPVFDREDKNVSGLTKSVEEHNQVNNTHREQSKRNAKPMVRRSISSCGRFDFKHSLTLDSHHFVHKTTPVLDDCGRVQETAELT